MSKITYNIVILLLICILAALIPMNKFLFNGVKEPDFNVEYTTQFEKSTDKADEISFLVKVNRKNYTLKEKFNLFIDDALQAVNPTTEKTASDNESTTYKVTYDISTYVAELEKAIIKITPTSEEFQKNAPDMTIEYASEKTTPVPSLEDIAYTKAITKSTRYFELYYMDKNASLLVPVVVPTSSYKLRPLVEAMVKDADPKYGLLEGKAAPYSSNVRLSGNNLKYYITGKEALLYSQGSTSSMNAANILLYTFTQFDSVKTVQIFVDEKTPDPDTYFHGLDLTVPMTPVANTPYLGFKSGENILLYKELGMGVQTYEAMFDALRSGSGADGTMPTVSKEVVLKSSELKDGTLTLDISGNFMTIYSGKQAAMNLAVDSIVKSYFEFDSVKSIVITFDGAPGTQVGDIDFSKPLKDILVNP